MSLVALDELAVAELVALAYGTRARLADLQSMKLRHDPLPDLARLLADAHRTLAEFDDALLHRATENAAEGWELFDLIKATHDGSIQRLSQRLREVLPPRESL